MTIMTVYLRRLYLQAYLRKSHSTVALGKNFIIKTMSVGNPYRSQIARIVRYFFLEITNEIKYMSLS